MKQKHLTLDALSVVHELALGDPTNTLLMEVGYLLNEYYNDITNAHIDQTSEPLDRELAKIYRPM